MGRLALASGKGAFGEVTGEEEGGATDWAGTFFFFEDFDLEELFRGGAKTRVEGIELK